MCLVFYVPPSISLSFPLGLPGYLAARCLIATYLWVFQIAFDDFRMYSTVVRGHALYCSIPSKCVVVVVELSMWLAWRLSCEKVGWGVVGMSARHAGLCAVYVSCCFVDILPSSLAIKYRYQCLQPWLLNYSFVFRSLFVLMHFGVFLLGMPYYSNGYSFLMNWSFYYYKMLISFIFL